VLGHPVHLPLGLGAMHLCAELSRVPGGHVLVGRDLQTPGWEHRSVRSLWPLLLKEDAMWNFASGGTLAICLI